MKAKQTLTKLICVATVIAAVVSLSANTAQGARPAMPPRGVKYVFFFIGDGMASVQVQAAEAYLAREYQNTGNPNTPYDPANPKAYLLNMSTMPVYGMQTTYAADRFITDSASAGTAMACGIKARDGVIAKKLDGSNATTIAQLAKAKGKKIGIISSVPINHATPAVFYAHQVSRNNYYDIALQLANSNFDFFGGGGFVHPTGNPAGSQSNIIPIVQSNGFTVVNSAADLAAVTPGTRTIAIDPYLDGAALYYDIDRVDGPNTMTLAQYTAEAIRLLDNSNGFFMMVEGGKIDWAGHANDARANIDDTLAFDDAVGVAMDFYAAHPNDTLIVVTGDHECGGMTIGWAGTKYNNFFQALENQTVSYVGFAPLFNNYKVGSPWNNTADNISDELKALMLSSFGLDFATCSDFQKAQLESAYDRSRNNARLVSSEEDYLLYGGYDAFTVTVTHILNQKAGLGWTSYSHTGVPVPVYAMGKEAYQFDGFYDNTDIAKKLAMAMRVKLDN